MPRLFSPRLFISYSRQDLVLAERIVGALQRRGFRVFLDSNDIDPGDNFVTKLSEEIRLATAIIPVISQKYSLSRWAQAELYQALTTNKVVIPILISNDSIFSLDDPLQRLLKDRQYVTIPSDSSGHIITERFAELLSVAHRRYRYELIKRSIPFGLGTAIFISVIWWAITNLNELDKARQRKVAISEISESKSILQHERISSLASVLTEDKQALGEIKFLSHDSAQTDTTRLNALALGAEIGKGRKAYRWYVQGIDIGRAKFQDAIISNASFIGGSWREVDFRDSILADVFWEKEKGFSLSGSNFDNVKFLGSQIEAINAIDVAFRNCKFVGSVIDTTNFSKVRFFSDSPQKEGNPIITPYYTKFERSVLVSGRSPPEKGVLNLTMTGDDVVFDDVLFVDCRLDGWFSPEWFRNSTFLNCELPDSLTKESLERAGNQIRSH
ncbi:MAG: TIR domain-containing protein [Rhodoferax sp.]|nr:TIR domain-containing protein [Rhodoferax sp.]